MAEDGAFAYTGRQWIDTYVVGEPHPLLPDIYPVVTFIPPEWRRIADWALHFMVPDFVPTKIQVEWIRQFLAHQYVMLNAPRGHGKTYVATLMLPIYFVCEYPDIAVLVISASKELAGDYSDAIRKTFESNEHLRAFYGAFDVGVTVEGKIARASKWGTQHWAVPHRTYARKEPTLQIAGVGSKIIGKHPDIIISDDLVQVQETWAPAQERKRETWFKRVIKPMTMPGFGDREETRIWVLGTRKDPNDIYQKIIDMEIFYCRSYQAILERPKNDDYTFTYETKGGKRILTGVEIHDKKFDKKKSILMPELWTIERLLIEERAIGKRVFSSEYQNNPIPDEGNVFKLDDLRYWHELPVPMEKMIKYQWLDSALSEKGKGSGFSVILTLGVHHNNFYIIDIERGQWGFAQNKRNFERAYDKYTNIPYTGTEAIMFQSIIAQDLLKTTTLPLVTRGQEHLKHIGDKNTRIRQLDVHFENNRIYINPNLKEFENFKMELLGFPFYEFNDIIDALEGAIWLYHFKRPKTPEFVFM